MHPPTPTLKLHVLLYCSCLIFDSLCPNRSVWWLAWWPVCPKMVSSCSYLLCVMLHYTKMTSGVGLGSKLLVEEKVKVEGMFKRDIILSLRCTLYSKWYYMCYQPSFLTSLRKTRSASHFAFVSYLTGCHQLPVQPDLQTDGSQCATGQPTCWAMQPKVCTTHTEIVFHVLPKILFFLIQWDNCFF